MVVFSAGARPARMRTRQSRAAQTAPVLRLTGRGERPFAALSPAQSDPKMARYGFDSHNYTKRG